jgi:hypothetical protein
MKTVVPFFLVLSLGMNAFCAFVVFRPKPASHPAVAAMAPAAAATSAAAKLDPEIWTKFGREDLAAFVGELRAAGFPPDLVRALLNAQLLEASAAQRKALLGSADNLPFWKDQVRDPKVPIALRQLTREQSRLMREILGPDAETDDPMARMYQNRGLDFLPGEKAGEVRQILREFEERRADMYASNNYVTDREKFTALDREQQAALARTLTPAELLEYNLRTSNTANSLRENLSAFKPTEQEFRAIFELQAAFDQRFSQEFFPMTSPEEQRQRSDAQKLLAEQIKARLAPERAAEYERMTDYNYRRTHQLVTRLELPPETTNQLYAVQKEYEQKRNDMYRAGNRNRDELVAQMTQLQQEAASRVAPLLGGARNVEAYKQYGGSWLNNMVPRPPVARPAAPAPKQ